MNNNELKCISERNMQNEACKKRENIDNGRGIGACKNSNIGLHF